MEWTKKMVEDLESQMQAKHILFAKEYLVDFNGKFAALRVGYAEKTAAVQASRLLIHDNVRLYLQYLISDRNKRLQVTADKVLQEMAKIAFHDVSELLDYFDGNVLFKDLDSMKFPEIIKSIEVKEIMRQGQRIGQVAKIQVWDKVKALEMLGKYTSLLTDRMDLTTNGESMQPLKVVNININHRAKGEKLTE